jgi:tripartite-type tricarboxylate transporter receptor subunit TctC
MQKRQLLAFALALTAVLPLSSVAACPDKSIRLIVPTAAGGAPDILMRALATQLSLQMGVPFIIDNKPGASYVIRTMEVVLAAPDGSTLTYGNTVSLTTNRALMPKLPYEVDKNLTPIGGDIGNMLENTPVVGPQVKAERMRALGISGTQRSAQYPDVPTISESSVPGFDVTAWGGIIGPANMSKELVNRINTEIRTALASPVVRELCYEYKTVSHFLANLINL